MRRRRILVTRGICGAHGGHETAEVRGLRVSGWGGCLCVDLSAFGIIHVRTGCFQDKEHKPCLTLGKVPIVGRFRKKQCIVYTAGLLEKKQKSRRMSNAISVVQIVLVPEPPYNRHFPQGQKWLVFLVLEATRTY